MYGLRPASTSQLHYDSPANPSRFRQMVVSHWPRLVRQKSTSAAAGLQDCTTSDQAKCHSYTLDSNLTNDITNFVCCNELLDLELFRKTIGRQASALRSFFLCQNHDCFPYFRQSSLVCTSAVIGLCYAYCMAQLSATSTNSLFSPDSGDT